MISEVKNNIDIFNLIRAIAVLCVFFMHSLISVNDAYGAKIAPWFLHTPAWGAMWIFYFLSGYLLGKGFYNNKYKTDLRGIIKFYISRIIRIVPPYLFFLLICFIFIDPKYFFNNLSVLFHLLTFTFNGTDGIVGVGATWFISTIMQLYFLCPIVYKFVLSKINYVKDALFILILFGFTIRCLEYVLHMNVFTVTIVSPLSNLDLFFGGMLLNYICNNSYKIKHIKCFRMISVIFLLFVIFLSIILSYKESGLFFCIYAYVFPSLYLLSLIFVVFSYDSVGNRDYISPLNIRNIVANPIRIIELLGIISFEFYLYHSNILKIFADVFSKDAINPYIFNTIFVSFIMTSVFSYIIYITMEKPINKYRLCIRESK